MRRKVISALLTATMVFTMVGCGSTASTEKAETREETTEEAAEEKADSQEEESETADSASIGDKSMVIGSGQAWSTADVLNSYDGWYYVRYGIGETLTKMNNDMTISGWLAEDGFTSSDDNKTWTFTVKEGVTFSNGDVCDGAAVKASLEHVMTDGDRALDYFTATEITADGQTVTITCDKAEPILPNKLADPYFTIVDMGVDYTDVVDNGYIATGPFTLDSFDSVSKETSVVKNEHYWNGDVNLDKVTFIYSEDQTSLTLAMQSGEFDAIYNMSMADIGNYEDAEGFAISRTASGRTTHGFMNQNGILGDKTLRQAILQCLDKESICTYQLSGQYIAGKTLITPSANYGFDELTDPYAYDPENANKILDEAGYKDIDGDGFREDLSGNPIDISFIYYTGRPEQQIMVEAMQMQAVEIGIKITPVVHESATVMDELKAGEFDLLCMSINVLNCADPENHLKTYFMEGGSYASYGWSDERFNEIMEELSSTSDANKRIELVKECQQILLDDAVCNFFCYPLMNFVMKDTVSGLESTPADYYWLNAETNIK